MTNASHTEIGLDPMRLVSYIMSHDAELMKRWLPIEKHDIPIHQMALNCIPKLK